MEIAGCELTGRTGHEAGRELLKQLYFARTGQELPPILVTERGKPYFEGNPVYFSITHTKRHAFCALSERPVGIDAEETDRVIRPVLEEKILSQEEKQALSSCSDRNGALLRLWVLKEAAVKCSGEGLRGYPNRTCFSPDDPRVRIMQGCYVAIIEEGE